MQFITASILLGASLASAANIAVTNACTFDVFIVHGSPAGNDAPVQISANGGQFSQPIGTSSGQLLQFDTVAAESNPIQFNWTPGMDGNTYVGIAEVGGSALAAYNNTFAPATDSPPANCYAVNCAAGDDSCYHTAGGPTCPSDVDWNIKLCA